MYSRIGTTAVCGWFLAVQVQAGLIHIGSQKQFFIDDYLIESMLATRQVLNPARKVDHNPIIRPEKPWEGNDVRVSKVIYEEEEGLFRMWYSGNSYKASQGQGEFIVEAGGGKLCIAISKDGFHWEKPNLGKVEFQGSRENNILPREQFRPYFFKDRHEKDPAKRYKGLERTGTTGTPGMQFDLYYSPDGFQWTAYENNPIIDTAPRVGRWGPTGFMGWDPIRQTYAVHMENCAHLRCPLGKRLIGRAESPDMIHWSQPETIILPDEQDYPDLQFYHMALTVYEGMYVGMLWNFRTTNTSILPQAVFSRDGIHYNRDYREPFIPPGPNGSFDSAVVYAQDPKVHEGRLLNYYTGVNWRSPESLYHLGDKALGAVGLAVTPPDGFVSLDGVHGHERQRYPFSEVVTRSFTFSGDRLHLNVRSALRQWGAGPCEVRVEIIGADHHPIEGYGFKDADPITTTGLAHVASWKGKSDLSGLKDRPVKLRIHFKNAKLYSFQFK